jgi:hypothetical protein
MKFYLLLFFVVTFFCSCGTKKEKQEVSEHFSDTDVVSSDIEVERTSVEVKVLDDRTH